LGPIEKGERRWLFLITELVPDQVRPFESVREVCLQNATQQKRLELLRQEEEEAMKQYPIILSPSWGQGK
ncbi:MAG: peptidylprolyl isomerase, partial [Bacteroidia bacterium]|nr:peptidylprolyl isomerase [Bacteroidia bacterium]